MRITSKGQVTIPLNIREQMGFLPDTEVEFELTGDNVIIRKVEEKQNRGKRLVEHLRGRATAQMTTDEIMALTRE
jgi:AbrB family looped-hinge helix DNA binding protein